MSGVFKYLSMLAALLFLQGEACPSGSNQDTLPNNTVVSLNDLQVQLEQAQAALQTSNDDNETKACQLRGANDNVQNLQGERDAAQDKVRQKTQELESAQAEVRRQQAAVQTAQSALQAAQAAAANGGAANQAALQAARAQAASAAAARDAAQQAANTAQANLATANQQNNNLVQQNRDLAAAVAARQAEAQQAQAGEQAALAQAQAAQAALLNMQNQARAAIANAGGLPAHRQVIDDSIAGVETLGQDDIAGRTALENAANAAFALADPMINLAGAYAAPDDAAIRNRQAFVNTSVAKCFIIRENDVMSRAQGLTPALINRNFPMGHQVVDGAMTAEEFLQKIEDACMRLYAPVIIAVNERNTINTTRDYLTSPRRSPEKAGWNVNNANFLSDFLVNYLVRPVAAAGSVNFQPSGQGFTIDARGADATGIRKIVFSTFALKLTKPDVDPAAGAAADPSSAPLIRHENDRGFSLNPGFNAFNRCLLAGQGAADPNALSNCFYNIGTALAKFIAIEGSRGTSYATLSVPLSPFMYQMMMGKDTFTFVELLAILKIQNEEEFYRAFTTLNYTSAEFDNIRDVINFDNTEVGDADTDARIQRLWAYNVYSYYSKRLSYLFMDRQRVQIDGFLAGFNSLIPADVIQFNQEAGILNANTLKLALESPPISLAQFNAATINSHTFNPRSQQYINLLRDAVGGIVTNGCPTPDPGDDVVTFTDFLPALMRFWTGSSLLPEPTQPLRIHIKEDGRAANAPVQSHTCFNILDIPPVLNLTIGGIAATRDEQLRSLMNNLCKYVAAGGMVGE